MSDFGHLPEDFLHFVWRTRQYNPLKLRTTEGRKLRVWNPGVWNHDQGPDFSQARVEIDEIQWAGQVEIHLHSRDWYGHRHHEDPVYNHTVLHVVLESDGRSIRREDGTEIPELCLRDYLEPTVIGRYRRLHLSANKIPCQEMLGVIPASVIKNWTERMGVERMEEKAGRFQLRLEQTAFDWAQVCWEGLLRQMGGPVNGKVFEELAQRIPYRVVNAYTQQLEVAEALLFGGLGMLDGKPQDLYHEAIQEHWAYYKEKHQLRSWQGQPIKYSRMRPAGFPTVRISQSLAILARYRNLSNILLQPMALLLDSTQFSPSPYWQNHSRFGVQINKRILGLGQSQRESLVLNLTVPLSFLYHQVHGTVVPDHFERLLRSLKPENNRYTRIMDKLEFPNQDALESQGLLHLFRAYCQQKRCLDCRLGQMLLVSSPKTI